MQLNVSSLISVLTAVVLTASVGFAGDGSKACGSAAAEPARGGIHEMPAASGPAANDDAGAKLSVIKEQNGIRYLSGGSGDTEQDAIERMGGEFNLKVTLATQDGKYMGATEIRIEQQGKTVLDTHTDGPLFLAALPAGAYTVHVSGAGESFSRTVSVGGSGQQQLVFTWPASLDEPSRAGDAPVP